VELVVVFVLVPEALSESVAAQTAYELPLKEQDSSYMPVAPEIFVP